MAMQLSCLACGSSETDTKGFGTEQVEVELKELFPDHQIGRMDSDTTRGKHGHEKITVPEDYPRYPPWGNQIFPLVEFCTSNGNIVNVDDENSVRWEFKMENEN